MRKLNLKNLWTAIKRNPVVNAILAAIVVQIYQDYMTDSIDFGHIAGYLFMVCASVIARHFTVPSKEHNETIENLHLAIDRKGEKA